MVPGWGCGLPVIDGVGEGYVFPLGLVLKPEVST